MVRGAEALGGAGLPPPGRGLLQPALQGTWPALSPPTESTLSHFGWRAEERKEADEKVMGHAEVQGSCCTRLEGTALTR